MWSSSGWNDPSTASLSHNSLQPLATGTLMRGRYRVVSQLGKGGMGFVYLVQDENFDARPLRSMKEMILHLDDHQQQVHLVNFKREADVLETLRHTNIPRVYDSFTEFRRAYLVLEYVEGEDLKQVLDGTTGVLSPQVVGSWMIQLCTIVEYLHVHKPPIIFRDLKPSNVILTPDQRIILIDFGIATVFTADEKQANVGTRGYAALEQYTGEAEIRSDVYALGGMMHHLLTKSDPRLQPPFSFHARPPNRLNPAVTPELERVIMRCLEDDPDKRYQTVSDLHEALDDALHLSNTDTDTSSLRRADAGHAMLAIANVLAVSAADVADVAHVPPPRSPAPMSPGDAVSAAGTDGADAADTHHGSALATLLHRLPGPGARTGAQRQARAHRGRPHRVPAVWAVILLSAVVLLLTGGAFAALAPRGAVPRDAPARRPRDAQHFILSRRCTDSRFHSNAAARAHDSGDSDAGPGDPLDLTDGHQPECMPGDHPGPVYGCQHRRHVVIVDGLGQWESLSDQPWHWQHRRGRARDGDGEQYPAQRQRDSQRTQCTARAAARQHHLHRLIRTDTNARSLDSCAP